MTKKDYVAVAAAIRAEGEQVGACSMTIACIAARIARVFANDNPNFDRERFLTACGVQS